MRVQDVANLFRNAEDEAIKAGELSLRTRADCGMYRWYSLPALSMGQQPVGVLASAAVGKPLALARAGLALQPDMLVALFGGGANLLH